MVGFQTFFKVSHVKLAEMRKKGYFQQKFDNNKKEPKDYWKAISELINPHPSNIKFNLIDKTSNTPVQNDTTADFIIVSLPKLDPI